MTERNSPISTNKSPEAAIEHGGRPTRMTRRALLRAGITGAIATMAGGGVYEFILEPNEKREEAHRVSYDNQNVELAGEGLSITRMPIETLPSDEFAAIPDYKEGDDLSHARTFEILNKQLTLEVAVRLDDTQEVVVAVAAGSRLSGGDFSVGPADEGIVIRFADVDAYLVKDVTEHVAVQIQAKRTR